MPPWTRGGQEQLQAAAGLTSIMWLVENYTTSCLNVAVLLEQYWYLYRLDLGQIIDQMSKCTLRRSSRRRVAPFQALARTSLLHTARAVDCETLALGVAGKTNKPFSHNVP